MAKDYIVYFKMVCGSFRCMNNITTEFATYVRIPDTIKHKFELFKGYEPDDNGLIKYALDFKLWSDQLKKNPVYNIQYTSFFNHNHAVQSIYKKFGNCIDGDGDYLYSESITPQENQYMDACYNGGQTYAKEYEGECYGYDFNSFYPRLLSSQIFKIPIREGKAKNIDFMGILLRGKKLDYGYYNVEIISDHKNIKKIFSFSSAEIPTYTHYALEFAYTHREEYNIEIIPRETDDGNNCYIYDAADLITGENIFKYWFHQLSSIRSLFPKNKLVKHLLSSLWGHVVKKKSIMRTYEEIVDQGIKIGGYDCDYSIRKRCFTTTGSYYVLDNNMDPYRYTTARLKCFLVAYGRNRIGTVSLRDIDKVIRIHTDSVCFTRAQDLTTILHITAEAKSTGNLLWSGKINKKPIRL